MALDTKTINKLEQYYIQGKSYSEASKEMGIKYDTVKRYFDKWENQSGKNGENGKKLNLLRNEVIDARVSQYKSIVEMMKEDNRVTGIVDKVLNILNDDKTLKAELNKNGIRGLIQLLGTLTDKGIKFKDLELKEIQIEKGINVNVNKEFIDLMDQMKEFNSEINK